MAADGHSYERKADRALARDQVDEPDDGRGARAQLPRPQPHAAPDDPGVAAGAGLQKCSLRLMSRVSTVVCLGSRDFCVRTS